MGCLARGWSAAAAVVAAVVVGVGVRSAPPVAGERSSKTPGLFAPQWSSRVLRTQLAAGKPLVDDEPAPELDGGPGGIETPEPASASGVGPAGSAT